MQIQKILPSTRFAGALLGTATIGAVILLMTPSSFSQVSSRPAGPSAPAQDPGVRSGSPGAGQPISGLTTGQLEYFNDGLATFQETIFVQNPPPGGDAGLGPKFNSNSCVSCHSFPSAGGSSPAVNPQIAVATAMGASNRIPTFLKPDGPTLEVRFKNKPDGTPDGGVHALFTISGRSDAAGCNLQQEDFSNTSNLSFRIPTPVFGAGLMEAISDSTLKQNLASNSSTKAGLGISGRLNTSGNDGTLTRFGWKAQNKSLHVFAAEAYNVENGVTSYLFPQERDETPGCSFLASPVMGSDLADGIAQGDAGGDEFRTAPLWGLGQRVFFLHDGRTKDLMAAILAHSGNAGPHIQKSEANEVIRRFTQLSTTDQQSLLDFLRSL